ncbi:MAG: MFS transporter [Planctomycetota bacterium]|nr:MFS transporter [Planctomycetota bacterium]MDA1211631.1 MFS transporter [Planctomycetota bacterium]
MSLPTTHDGHSLSSNQRMIILTAAFLGWACSGLQMAVMSLAARSATEEFVRSGAISQDAPFHASNLLTFSTERKTELTQETFDLVMKTRTPHWYAWYNSSFLIGGALGGLVFGGIGDRFGRVTAMGLSILSYSAFSGIGYFSATPEQLLLLRFLTAMGVGGMWPNGVALASEAWSDASRPMLAGLIGAAANVGIVAVGILGYFVVVTPDSWRWLLLVVATPIFLGVWVLAAVPESPQWLTVRSQNRGGKKSIGVSEVFRPPLLKLTLIGIGLGAIPLLGGWGVTSWLIPWTDKAMGSSDRAAKAMTSILRAAGGTIGSLMGGYLANMFGRRTVYFLVSLVTFGLAEYIFFTMNPHDAVFGYFVFAVGFVSTIFFGWLPLYLPELFPTHARATGAGVSFNFGRILTAAGVLGTGALTAYFHEDYARAGRVTSLIYAVGMIIILFAPDTSKKKIAESTPDE